MPHGEYTSTDALAVSSELLKNNGHISISQSLHTAFSGYSENEHHLTRGVAYVASWLDYQLDAPSSARMSSLVAGDFAHGINRILATTLQHSLITGNILYTNFFATSLLSIELTKFPLLLLVSLLLSLSLSLLSLLSLSL
jgi:hypothetical protein